MNELFIVKLGREALLTGLTVAAPMLGLGLLVGIVISVFQATTQIQEQTLTFIPKIIAIFAALIIFGPWMLNMLIQYTHNLLINIPTMIG
ncbi:MAG TPA: flagellar biosynthesis protein FliQ [Clostridia bacterium]|nr:flagellar biosynthesis protein FliQ [Clostridia bacterium]